MPTYQYACTACEHRFEAVQSFSDSSLTECPECSGKLRKLFGAVGVVFKGSGFYRTDSRSGSSKSTSASSSSETKSSSSDAKSSDTKSTSSSASSSSDSKSSSAPAAAAS
ncbi:FmdB family zinc ribbon protein [Lentzea sp. NPDC058436]|uniref:FmdB family zinc ribbon protein n=1 Tax=Lentzea sp. NPDC058436 TaxID=3346499 RepID=UPI00364AF82B